MVLRFFYSRKIIFKNKFEIRPQQTNSIITCHSLPKRLGKDFGTWKRIRCWVTRISCTSKKTDSICKWPTFSRGTQLPIVVKTKARSHGLNQHFKTYVLKIQQLNGKGKTKSVQKLLISIPVSENKPKYQKHIYPENPEISYNTMSTYLNYV